MVGGLAQSPEVIGGAMTDVEARHHEVARDATTGGEAGALT